MAKQILVPLKEHDRIEEIIPYIEEVARPGMSVVFLIHYPVNDIVEVLQDCWETPVSPMQVMLAAKKLGERYSWEGQRRISEDMILPAREVLCKHGVDVTVDLYTDRLKRVVEAYTENGNVLLIVARSGIGLRIIKFLQETVGHFGWLKSPSFSPMLLLHPGHRV